MASGLSGLRKSYTALTAFERAVIRMRQSATNKWDIPREALRAVSTKDALHEAAITGAFLTIAGLALTESLKAEALHYYHAAFVPRDVVTRKKGQTIESVVATAREKVLAAEQDAEAWITALARLDEETGAAFMDTARMFGGPFADGMLKRSAMRAGCHVDDSEQYKNLRMMWGKEEFDLVDRLEAIQDELTKSY